MADSCVLETAGSETNVARDENGTPRSLVNWVTRLVGTTSDPHPDGALRAFYDPVARVSWYRETGAALNDPSGIERDASGFYFSGSAPGVS